MNETFKGPRLKVLFL